jgi:hypothetical protein
MPSPFPGMDPYLEDPFFWHQVHSQLIVALSHDLGGKLRPKYYAAIEISDVKERYLEIRQVGTHEAIAAIELRPPKNHQFQVLVSGSSNFEKIALAIAPYDRNQIAKAFSGSLIPSTES